MRDGDRGAVVTAEQFVYAVPTVSTTRRRGATPQTAPHRPKTGCVKGNYQMLTLLRRIFGRTRSSGSGSNPTVAAVFPDIDVDRIAADLHLEEEGAQRGARNQPEADTADLDRIEHAIIDRIDQIRNEGLGNFEEHSRSYAGRAVDTGQIDADIRSVANTAETDFDAEVARLRGAIENALDDLGHAERGFDHFCQNNRIYRPAHEGGGWFQWFAVFGLIVTIESVWNGFFFAGAHETGLIGGVSVALGISVVNVGLASVFGRVTQNVNHVRRWKRAIGTLSFLVGAGVALLFNFFVAHLRDAMTKLVWNEAAGHAFAQVAAVRVPESTDAWFLALLGLLAAAFAFWKIYGVDDSYPGYGQVSRKKRKAKEAYDDRLDEAIAVLTETRDKAIQNLDDARASSQTQIRNAARATQELLSLRAQRDPFLAQCDRKANLLLRRYREANRERRNEPPPAHFAKAYKFSPVPPLPPLSSKSEVKTSSGESGAVVNRAAERIHEACKSALDSFKHISAPDGVPPAKDRETG